MRASTTAVAAALIARVFAAPAPAPQTNDVQIASTNDQAADLLNAYAAAAPKLSPAKAAPAGAVASTTAYNAAPASSAAAAQASSGALQRRSACSPEPASPYSISIPVDTPDAWAATPDFASAANGASAPAGYSLIPGYQNLNGSAQANVYQGVDSFLDSYNPSKCSAECNQITGCMSFVIYFERNPTIEPDDTQCPNPSSLTRVKCAFYGIPLTAGEATNVGQYQSQFHVLIAGANAYTNLPPTPSSYTYGDALGDAAIMSPIKDNTYLGVQTFPNSAYDPSLCATACDQTTTYAKQHTPDGQVPRTCGFFDAYTLFKNGKDGIFTCAYYTQYYDASYATNKGQYDQQGNHYTIGFSNTYIAPKSPSMLMI